MIYLIIPTLFVLLLVLSFYTFIPTCIKSISLGRYFILARRPNSMSGYEGITRLIHLVLMLSVSFLLIEYLIGGNSVPSSYLSISNILVFFLLNEAFDFLQLTRRSKVTLNYMKVFKYTMTNFLVIFFCIMFIVLDCSKTTLSEISTFQNDIRWNIPMWNAFKLFPVFFVWVLSHKDKMNLYEKVMRGNELETFQIRLMYITKVTTWLLITICLFFAGNNTLMMLDTININRTIYITSFIIVAKITFLIVLYRAIAWLNINKNEIETELVCRKRLMFILVLMGLALVLKVFVP